MSFGAPRTGVVSSQSCGRGMIVGFRGGEASLPALPAAAHMSRMQPETRANTVLYAELLLPMENTEVLFFNTVQCIALVAFLPLV